MKYMQILVFIIMIFFAFPFNKNVVQAADNMGGSVCKYSIQ